MTGYYTPFSIVGTALTSIACGLLSTLTPHSNAGMWVGYQLMAGFARGLNMQQPLIAITVILPKSKLSIGTSLLMFCQVLGGALFLSFGQTIFSNQLTSALEHFAPNVDAREIFEAGATGFRSVVSTDQVQGVVEAYNRALTRIFVSWQWKSK